MPRLLSMLWPLLFSIGKQRPVLDSHSLPRKPFECMCAMSSLPRPWALMHPKLRSHRVEVGVQ
jgi:hypothetical protein